MKVCIDSCGWIEFFAEAENADFFKEYILSSDYTVFVNPIILFEVYKFILREYGKKYALEALAFLRQYEEIEISSKISIEAVHLSLEYKLGFADSLVLASAQVEKAILVTQDVDFKGIEGVKYIQKK